MSVRRLDSMHGKLPADIHTLLKEVHINWTLLETKQKKQKKVHLLIILYHKLRCYNGQLRVHVFERRYSILSWRRNAEWYYILHELPFNIHFYETIYCHVLFSRPYCVVVQEAKHFSSGQFLLDYGPLIDFNYILIKCKIYCVTNFLPSIAWFDPF